MEQLIMLKKIFTLFSFVSFVVLAAYSCSENDTTDNFLITEGPNSQQTILAIELEHHFENDLVWVILDNDLLLNDFITTDYTISAAWLSGPFEYSTGDHRLLVGFTNNPVTAQHNFTLTDTMTIRVTYNVENEEFSFFEQEGLFLERD